MEGKFSYVLPTRIEYGLGVVDTVGEETKRLGGRRALIVTDKGVLSTGLVDRVRKSLSDEGVSSYVFDKVVPNPRDYDCSAGAQYAKEIGTDILVAIGGGSSMDTAKTIGCLVTHGGTPQDWVGVALTHEILPLVCIPTTAGTGSEVTFFAVITDTTRRFKMSLFDVKLAPRVALVDPHVTVSMPKALTASTGMDALTHAIEAYTCRLAQPVTDGLALHAIKLISESLRRAVEEGGDIKARCDMMFGSLIAGLAFGNSDVAGVHCLAEALGSLYDTPHGVANSIFLPHVFEFNIPADPKKHADVARAMGLNVEGLPDVDAAQMVVAELKRLSREIGIPRLRECQGVKQEDFEKLAEYAAQNVSAPSNAREAGKDEYLMLLNKAYFED